MTRARVIRALVWTALGAAIAGLIVFCVGFVYIRPSFLRARIEKELRTHLQLDASLDKVYWSFSPQPRLHGEHLALRVPNRADLPPVIAIDSFWVQVGVLGVLRGRVGTVYVDGLHIVIPPGDAKNEALKSSQGGASKPKTKVIIDRVVTHTSELRILRQDPSKQPMVFAIHDLEMDELGFDRAIPFVTHLTNPIPTGEVTARGSLGPWAGQPAALPVAGDYQFTADLHSIAGIGGHLRSEGMYDGQIDRINVTGTTATPDFNLDLGGNAVPLTTTFSAVVDGSNGTTHLDPVIAKLGQTDIHVHGDLDNPPGPVGFDFHFDADVINGRLQDVVSLMNDTSKGIISGPIQLSCSITIPFGHTKMIERLHAMGRFTLAHTSFDDAGVQEKVNAFSQRALGGDHPDGERPRRVAASVTGRFKLDRGVLDMSSLTFRVPGATVALGGQYSMNERALDFEGELRMRASVSDALGGFKSLFIKPFDWYFRRGEKGTVIPIKVTGTPDKPSVGLRLGALMTRGK